MSQTIIEKLLNGAEVEWKPIDEIAEIYGGLIGKTKSDFEKGNAIYIPYKNIYDNISVDFNNVNLVNVSLDESQNRVEYGDILFTGSSETIEETGLSSVVTQKNRDPVYLNSFSFGVRINNKSLLIPDFSKYLFRSKFMRKEIIRCANGVTRFNLSKAHFKKIKIPIPPLSVQKEIVRILDAFTTHTAELTSELNERKKQYNYYRDKLLTFSDDQVKWETIEEIFTLKNGYTPSKSVKEYWIGGTVPWFRMEDIRANGRMLTESAQKVHINGVKGKLFPNNSIIMSTSATVGEHALILTDFLCNQRFTNFSVRERYKAFLDIKYVYYYFFVIDKKAQENTSISSFPSVQMDALKKWLFPIPPLSVQKEIVRKLDAFSMLTTSISDGLPREIELRNKQYKYYRGQLLSFSKPDLEN